MVRDCRAQGHPTQVCIKQAQQHDLDIVMQRLRAVQTDGDIVMGPELRPSTPAPTDAEAQHKQELAEMRSRFSPQEWEEMSRRLRAIQAGQDQSPPPARAMTSAEINRYALDCYHGHDDAACAAIHETRDSIARKELEVQLRFLELNLQAASIHGEAGF